jgi:hypothetical protein
MRPLTGASSLRPAAPRVRSPHTDTAAACHATLSAHTPRTTHPHTHTQTPTTAGSTRQALTAPHAVSTRTGRGTATHWAHRASRGGRSQLHFTASWDQKVLAFMGIGNHRDLDGHGESGVLRTGWCQDTSHLVLFRISFVHGHGFPSCVERAVCPSRHQLLFLSSRYYHHDILSMSMRSAAEKQGLALHIPRTINV